MNEWITFFYVNDDMGSTRVYWENCFNCSQRWKARTTRGSMVMELLMDAATRAEESRYPLWRNFSSTRHVNCPSTGEFYLFFFMTQIQFLYDLANYRQRRQFKRYRLRSVRGRVTFFREFTNARPEKSILFIVRLKMSPIIYKHFAANCVSKFEK